MNETMRTALPIFLGLFAAACSAAPAEEAQGMTGSAIVGGQEDAGHPNVGRIYWDVTRDDGAKGVSFCTGTVVTATAIISAAHCVLPPAGEHYSNYRITFDPVATAGSRFLPIARVVAHPAYELEKLGNGNDVSVMFLAAPVGVAPATLASGLDASVVGAAVVPVGYGRFDAAQPSDGKKRSVTVKLTGIDDNEFTYGEPGHTVCMGDSGGPVFMSVNGKEVIVGLNSWGSAKCDDIGHATRINRVLDWLKQTVGGAPRNPNPPPGDDTTQPPPPPKEDGPKPGGTTPGPMPTPGGTESPEPTGTDAPSYPEPTPGGTDPSSRAATVQCVLNCYFNHEHDQNQTEMSACFDGCFEPTPS